MKRPSRAVLFFLSCLLTAPLLAQTTIGGGTCSSASTKGIYAVSITGRRVAASGAFTNVFQANGAANFDGLSMVTVTLTADTNQAVATALTWSGTYSMQANCAGIINITSGGSGTFNLVLFDGGTDFLLTGSDATYSYAGNGITQPASCSASSFVGVYTLNATGFALTGGSVSGAENGAGLLQFDGQSQLTVNFTLSRSGVTPQAITLTGSYSVSSNCLGSAVLTDSQSNSYAMSFSLSAATKVNGAAFFAALAQNSKFLLTGSGHAVFGQPTARLVAPGFPDGSRSLRRMFANLGGDRA